MAKKKKILWTGPALNDLKDIRDYVSQDDPTAAKRLAEKIRNGVLRLADHPLSGRVVPELSGLDYREVIVAPYRIVYAVKRDKVIIFRVWHGRRELAP
jgi:addiction module RelE/StbE family toxin